MTVIGGLFNVAAFCIGAVTYRWAKHKEIATNVDASWIALFGTLFGLLAAHFSEWLAEGSWAGYSLWSFLNIFDGRSIIGGLIGGWVAVEIYKWRKGIKISLGDAFALSLPLAEAVGRIGCWFNGCCYGKQASLPIAVYQHGEWRYPTQFISAIAAILIFFCLFSLRNKLKRGQLFASYLILFGVVRMVLEPLRADYNLGYSGLLSTSSALAVAISGIFLFRLRAAVQTRIYE